MAKIPFKRKSIGDDVEINETTLNHEHNSERLAESEEEAELQSIINEELRNSNASHSNDPSFLKNVKDQKTVSLDDTKGSSKESKVINFMNEEAVNEYTSSESKKSENKQTKDDFAGKSVEDIQKELKQEEEKSKNQYTPDDMKEFASFIILLIDTIFSNALRWWSKDTSVTAYSLSKPSQDKLTKSLTYILIKYQAKFSIEWMFLITLVFMYAPPFLAANARRKEVMKKQQAKTYNQTYTGPENNNQQTNANTSNDVITPEVIDDSNDILPKRKNSRPRKHRS